MTKQRRLALIYLLLAILLLSLTGTATGAGTPAATSDTKGSGVVTPFKDVEGSDSNAIFIKYVAERGLIKGFPDGSYHPTGGLTRAEAATLLVRTAGLPLNTKSVGSYKDLAPDYWAYAYILTANNAGYLTGYPDGSFKPDKKLTRAEGISLFMRLSKQSLSSATLPTLSDMDSKHWAAPAVAAALQAGMIGLSQDSKKFYPDQDFRRGDMARALGILLTKDPDLSKASLIGSLTIKNGDVKVTKAGSKEAKLVTSSLDIGEGDLIETGKAGEAELNYSDGSNLLLKADSKLLVKTSQGRSYIKTDGTQGVGVDNLEVNMLQGKLFGALATKAEAVSNANTDKTQEKAAPKTGSLSSRLASLTDRMFLLAAGGQEQPWYQTAEKKKVKVKVDMPWGVAAVRGSFWGNAVTSTGCSTTLLEGSAEVVTPSGTQPLNPGTSSAVTSATAPPSAPAPMSVAQAQEWVAQKEWVQQTAVTIQQNQETTPPPPAAADAPPPVAAPLAATTPGNTPNSTTEAAPAVTAPAITAPSITEAVNNVLTAVNNALVQVAQSAGISININGPNTTTNTTNTTNNTVTNTTSGNNSTGGGGSASSTTTPTSSSTPALYIGGRASYLEIDTAALDNNQLTVSGLTLPNQTVTISSPMLAQLSKTTSDADGKFAFTGLSVSTSAASTSISGTADSIFVAVSPDASNYTQPSAALILNGIQAGSISPALPVKIDLPRLVRYSAGTDLYLSGSVPKGKAYNIIVYYNGLTSPLTGTSNQSDGSFSINVGSVDSGTILCVTVQNPDSTAVSSLPVASALVPVVSLDTLTVLGTTPYSGSTLDSSTQSLKVIFDRNIIASSEYANIALNSATGTSVTLASGSISISTNTLSVALPTLASGQLYTLQVPANAVKAMIGTGQNEAVILSFRTPGSSSTTGTVDQLSNTKLNLAVSADSGRFTLGTTAGSALLTTDDTKSLIYGWSNTSPSPGTSITTLQLDGTNYLYGNTTSGTSEYWEQAPASSGTDSNLSTYCFSSGKVKVQQSLQLVNNQLVMKYTINNTDSVAHSAGLRIMLDTKVGGNDSSTFRVNGQPISEWTNYTGSAIPAAWYGIDYQPSPGVMALGQNLLTQSWVPDRFLIGSYSPLYGNLWDYTGSGALYDSAVAMYWNPVSIGAGASKECTWSFGVIPDDARLVLSATPSVSSLDAGSASTPSISVSINTLGMAGSTLTASLVNASGTAIGSSQSTTAVDASGNCSATLTVPANISAGTYYINIADGSTLLLSVPIAAGSTTPTSTAPTITEIAPTAISFGSDEVVPLMAMPELSIVPGTGMYSSLLYQVSPATATITALSSGTPGVADFVYTATTSVGITKQLAIKNTGFTLLNIAATSGGISATKSVSLRVVPQLYINPPNLTTGYGATSVTVSDTVYGGCSPGLWSVTAPLSLALYDVTTRTAVSNISLPTPSVSCAGSCSFTLPAGLSAGSYWLLVNDTSNSHTLGIAQFDVEANPAAAVNAFYSPGSGLLNLTCAGVPSGASFDPIYIGIMVLDQSSGEVFRIPLYNNAVDTYTTYPFTPSTSTPDQYSPGGYYYYNSGSNTLTVKVYGSCQTALNNILSNISGKQFYIRSGSQWCVAGTTSSTESMLPLPLTNTP